MTKKITLPTPKLRSAKAVQKAEDALGMALWYGRKMDAEYYRKTGTPAHIIKGMLEAKKIAEKRYGKKELESHMASDWHWGYLSGKISALRWALGDNWDCLDS